MADAAVKNPTPKLTLSRTLAKLVLDSLPSRVQDASTDFFPWFSPSRAKVEAGEADLFPEEITDNGLIQRYQRYQLVKVIIDDVPEDALRYGFEVKQVDAPDSTDFDTKFKRVYKEKIHKPFQKAVRLCRLFGYSFIYFGYREGETPNLSLPPGSAAIQAPVAQVEDIGTALNQLGTSTKLPPIAWLLPLSKTRVTMEVGEKAPIEISALKIAFKEGSPTVIHPSRVVHLENEGINDDLTGHSVLEPVWDLLTVQKNADWAIGQDLFRGAAGLLVLFAAEGATSQNASDALLSIQDIHAKSRLVVPPKWDAKELSSSKKISDVVGPYETIVRQISAGARIPIAELLSKGSYILDLNYEAYIYSYQQLFMTPLLEKIFKKFQETGQLPEGSFEIVWKQPITPMKEAAKAEYLAALSKRMESTTQPQQPSV